MMELVKPQLLRHIEGFSAKRALRIKEKILSEGRWTRPLCIDRRHYLVLDGQHRLEAALALGLTHVPCQLFDYATVEVWSLRPTHEVSREQVIQRAISGDIYPYKTAKHRFPCAIEKIAIPLDELFV